MSPNLQISEELNKMNEFLGIKKCAAARVKGLRFKQKYIDWKPCSPAVKGGSGTLKSTFANGRAFHYN